MLFHFSITDCLTCSGLRILKSKQSMSVEKIAMLRAVADSLEEAGDRLFTFTRLPPTQWRSARTTNAIERLHEEFKRRIKTQTVLPVRPALPCCF